MTANEYFDLHNKQLYAEYLDNDVSTAVRVLDAFLFELTCSVPLSDDGTVLIQETMNLNAKWNELARMLEEKYGVNILPRDALYNHVLHTAQRLKGDDAKQ